MQSPIDFSPLAGFPKFIIGGITALPKIFSKNFIKERYYLHIFVTLPIVLSIIRLGFLYFRFEDFPIGILLLAGWAIGYTINLIREGLLEYLGKAKFDWCDVHSGGYAGILATIIYILI